MVVTLAVPCNERSLEAVDECFFVLHDFLSLLAGNAVGVCFA